MHVLHGWLFVRRTVHSNVVGRDYYINKATGEKRWTMPDEVRFHISDELQLRLYSIFNIGHIEAFKRYTIGALYLRRSTR